MKPYEEIIKEKILQKRVMSPVTLEQAVKVTEKNNSSLLAYLIDNRLVEETKILRLLAEVLNIEFIALKKENVSQEVLEKIPAKFAWHYQFVPLHLDKNKLRVAVNLPLDTRTKDEIELVTGHEIIISLARREKIKELLKLCYGLGAETVEHMVSQDIEEISSDENRLNIEDIREKAEEASVLKLVNQIIVEAYHKRATDIHIEPYRGKIRLRYRIDGVLFDQHVPENLSRFLPAIISRIKIMGNLNIVERRIPQDGRALVRVEDQTLDLRVSILPTPHGESVVVRILPTKMFFNLEKLGLFKDELAVFEDLLRKPNGIIFVTGPTGSGKTTTLYACLQHINRQDKKIISIEDPIEYEMRDIIQIQVNPSVGLTFAKGLRSMLRHDPDIMMVGEVRDKETAEIAVRVALTGHLVFSTLHTNDAPSSISRLIDIGVEPYLLASSVEAFIAQRLVRTICPKCSRRVDGIEPKLKKHIKSSIKNKQSELKFSKGIGCEYCNFTGFYGRIGVYEILPVNDRVRELIKRRVSAGEIRKEAIQRGMRTLLQDCWEKVARGITTVEEALRLSQDFISEMESVNSQEENFTIKKKKKS
jgi:type II secretory ATPase GspE/PulE/Tfp pilus assembly ATPase PilB-like protein